MTKNCAHSLLVVAVLICCDCTSHQSQSIEKIEAGLAAYRAAVLLPAPRVTLSVSRRKHAEAGFEVELRNVSDKRIQVYPLMRNYSLRILFFDNSGEELTSLGRMNITLPDPQPILININPGRSDTEFITISELNRDYDLAGARFIALEYNPSEFVREAFAPKKLPSCGEPVYSGVLELRD